ncbi:MAG: flavodoxin-dependent (E)-4-hydroxy-3-methylbut-2-enyl-diphosphate synthase [Anaerolineaceae bacterium]|nr:flavodoxin-dependent (E)-4-hydroxy-3-methylbut-2-enyl-diphosphate synthase [Anaerolineaceae bacterium]
MRAAETNFPRRRTRTVHVGSVPLGSGHPIALQSMTTTATCDVAATVAQIRSLAAAGAAIVRVAVPTIAAAESLRRICGEVEVPLVADIHFKARLALAALEAGVEKIRLNPGNVGVGEDLYRVIDAAGSRGVAIRIGVNSGSVMARDDGRQRQHTPREIAERMVEAVQRYLDRIERRGFRDIVLSLKGSDVPTTIQAYRLMAGRCDYPLHLGITAAGPREEALLKSALGLGALLSEGIGDTLRISITGDPVTEVQAGRRMLEVLDLAPLVGVDVISCPTCGRCEVDLAALAERLWEATREIRVPLRVAVMGCVVNGPGEAREADLGMAAGRGFGVLFRHGHSTGEKIPQDQLFDRLMAEIHRLSDR